MVVFSSVYLPVWCFNKFLARCYLCCWKLRLQVKGYFFRAVIFCNYTNSVIMLNRSHVSCLVVYCVVIVCILCSIHVHTRHLPFGPCNPTYWRQTVRSIALNWTDRVKEIWVQISCVFWNFSGGLSAHFISFAVFLPFIVLSTRWLVMLFSFHSSEVTSLNSCAW